METNSTTGLNGNNAISIINFETFLNTIESDFSEWKFYDDSLYKSVFSLNTRLGAPIGHITKTIKLKKSKLDSHFQKSL